MVSTKKPQGPHVRVARDLMKRIKVLADQERRSVTKQVHVLLEKALEVIPSELTK